MTNRYRVRLCTGFCCRTGGRGSEHPASVPVGCETGTAFPLHTNQGRQWPTAASAYAWRESAAPEHGGVCCHVGFLCLEQKQGDASRRISIFAEFRQSGRACPLQTGRIFICLNNPERKFLSNIPRAISLCMQIYFAIIKNRKEKNLRRLQKRTPVENKKKGGIIVKKTDPWTAVLSGDAGGNAAHDSVGRCRHFCEDLR